MINKHVRRFCCEDISKIENYGLAISDKTKSWVCHHRLETHTSDGERRLTHLSVEELKALDVYYNRPTTELIFLTRAEHTGLHNHSKKGKPGPTKGKHFSEESRKKMSEAKKGKPTWNKGKKMLEELIKKNSESHKGQIPWNKGKTGVYSLETKRKLSEIKKGKSVSRETKRKMSESHKGKNNPMYGRHWKLVDAKRVYY